MQIYVLNRAREVLATTSSVYDDKHTLILDAGSSSYEFSINKQDEASQYMDSGNYIVLQDDNNKTWLFTILYYEETQLTKTVYAEDAGIELLNKTADVWKNDQAYDFKHYFDIVTAGTPWKLGVNELTGLTRKLNFEGRDTGLSRLLSVLTEFGHAKCTFDVTFKMAAPADFKVNVYKSIGNDRKDIQIVYNVELNDITKKESRAEFVTALQGVGGTLQNSDGSEQSYVDFADLEYSKDGLVTTKGDKFLRAVNANKIFNPGQSSYIEGFYEYDTQSPSELLNRTITQLKTYSEPQYTYTADVKVIDSTLKIGDTVTIIDHDYNPALYLSARVAKLEKSYTDPSKNTIEFCNYQLINSQLADKVAKLQNIVNQLPSASQVNTIISNVSALTQKQDELTQKITSADGKSSNFYGKAEPTNPQNGDLWYKALASGDTEMYQYQNGAWSLLASTATTSNLSDELNQAKADLAQTKEDAQSAYDEALKATDTANGAKAQTDEALKQAKQANDSYTALAKEVADNKSSVDADYQKAQADIAQAQKDLSSVTDTVTEVKKGQDELSSKVAGKVDNTVYQTYVKQTNQSLSEKLVASDLNGYAKTVDVTKSIDGVKTTIADNTGKIATMQTDINGVKTNVKNAQGDITTLQTDVSGVKTTIADHTGKITQLATDVNGIKSTVSNKVDKTTYQSYVVQTDKALSTKLTASDLQGYAKKTDVKQTTDGLSASITKVQGDLSGLQIGGTNLLNDTERERSANRPVTGYTDIFTQNLATPPTGTVFTVSFEAKATTDKTVITNYFHDSSGKYADGTCLRTVTCQKSTPTGVPDGNAQLSLSTQWKRYWITWTWSQEMTQPNIHSVSIGRYFSSSANGTVYIRRIKLEKGNKATDWCMSDNDFQSQLNTLSGKITATSERLSSVYTKSETDAKLKTKVEQSALTQTSNNLSASISKNSKILSSIGLTSDTAYINANKIALNGKTLMTNAVINDVFIGNVSANKITTGTLNAAKVNLINVNASNISTGTLNGIKITSTGKDPSGTSSTTTIQSGYIDTNVINCSDYIMVGKADPDPRKRWQTKQDNFGMWFTCPAKLNGHSGNSASDYQTEMQGFIGSEGWNYKKADATGTGASGIQLALTPQQIWGNPYGGDSFFIGNWVNTAESDKSKDIRDGAMDPVLYYSYTGQSFAVKNTLIVGKDLLAQCRARFNENVTFDKNIKIGVTPGLKNGIRSAWVSWNGKWGGAKIPCLVNSNANWGGIGFPFDGNAVIFNDAGAVATAGTLQKENKHYNGWGDTAQGSGGSFM